MIINLKICIPQIQHIDHEYRKQAFNKEVNKKTPIIKKKPAVSGFFSDTVAWRCPTFPWGNPKVSLAQSSFTSEFGMGSGGTYSLRSPGIHFAPSRLSFIRSLRWVNFSVAHVLVCTLRYSKSTRLDLK